MQYVTAKEARQIFKISPTTLYLWKESGKIQYKRLSDKKILYDVDSVLPNDIYVHESIQRKNVIYARVSTTKQKQDLDNQIETIKSYCLAKGIVIDDIYKDIASGMNNNRADLNFLIDKVIKGEIDTIFITFKDRLTRFNFELYEHLFTKFNTKIVILDTNEETNSTFQTELTNDLISIIHHFSIKLYSNRRKKLKEIEKIIESE